MSVKHRFEHGKGTESLTTFFSLCFYYFFSEKSYFGLRSPCLLFVVYMAVSAFPANTRHWANVGLLLSHRLRRWANINPALTQCLCLLCYLPPTGILVSKKQTVSSPLTRKDPMLWGASLTERSEVECSASNRQGSNSVSGGQFHPIILRIFSWPSLAYMCTGGLKPHSFIHCPGVIFLRSRN